MGRSSPTSTLRKSPGGDQRPSCSRKMRRDGSRPIVAKLVELLSAKSERVSKDYLPLVIAATFLDKFSCQFEECPGFLEIAAG